MQCTDLTLPEVLRSQVLIFHFDNSIKSFSAFAVVRCNRVVNCTGVAVGVYSGWHSVQISTRPPVRPIQTNFIIFSHYIYANIGMFRINQVDFLLILSYEYLSFFFLFQATERHYSKCMCVCNFALQQDVSYHISTFLRLFYYQISLYFQLND